MYLFPWTNREQWEYIRGRYERSNRALNEELPEILSKAIRNAKFWVKEEMVGLIDDIPDDKRSELLKPLLEDKMGSIRAAAAGMIGAAPESDRVELLKKALNDRDVSVGDAAAKNISTVPEEERAALLNHALESEQYLIRAAAASQIYSLPPEERMTFINKALADKNGDVRGAAAEMIPFAPEEKRVELLDEAMRDGGFGVRNSAVKAIDSVPESNRLRLLEEELKREHGDSRIAIKIIGSLPETERGQFIKRIFKSGLSFNLYDGAKLLGLASKDEYPDLLQEARHRLASNELQFNLKMIDFLPEKKRARWLRDGLQDKNYFVRRSAADSINSAPEPERALLLKIAIGDPEKTVRIGALNTLGRMPTNIQNKVLDFMEQGENMGAVKVPESKLYVEAPEKFLRKKFAKSGSGTTLLGQFGEESLRGKAIIRHITLPAYLSWKKAFEAHEFWRSKGFDYVPIEPILSAAPRKNLEIDVATQVLGPSTGDWEEVNRHFRTYISMQRQIIESALTEAGIIHGHLHEWNFCLVFDKNPDGSDDYTKRPRVYAIDFDQAISTPERKKS